MISINFLVSFSVFTFENDKQKVGQLTDFLFLATLESLSQHSKDGIFEGSTKRPRFSRPFLVGFRTARIAGLAPAGQPCAQTRWDHVPGLPNSPAVPGGRLLGEPSRLDP